MSGAAAIRRVALAGAGVAALLGGLALPASSSAPSARPAAAVAPPDTGRVWWFLGHGSGSGEGMGQWGALGDAVRFGWSYHRILAHFYGGTKPGRLRSLGFGTDPFVSVLVSGNLDLQTNRGFDPVLTAAVPLEVSSTSAAPPVVPVAASSALTAAAALGSSSATPPVIVAAGTAIDLHLHHDGSWALFEGRSCPLARRAAAHGTPVASGFTDPVVAPAPAAGGAGVGNSPDSAGDVTICRHAGGHETVPGGVEAYDREGYERTLAIVPIERYVAGVTASEMPASWASLGAPGPSGEPAGFQALEAEAVAARSYAVAYGEAGGWNGYTTICDSTVCQVYGGDEAVAAASSAAARATAGQIRVTAAAGAPSAAVATRYSASTGGWSAPGTSPAVPDPGDACLLPGLPLACNPVHTWRVAVRLAPLSAALGLGRLTRLQVVERNGYGAFGGRVVRLVVTGRRGQMMLSGDAFAGLAGLPSAWFVRVRAPAIPIGPAAEAGLG